MPTDTERLDREHVFGTWTRQHDHWPTEIVNGSGASIVTADGRTIVDLSSQMACANLGYSAQRVVDAVADQVASMPYARSDLATEPRAHLGASLAEVTPGDLSKTFFSTGGSLAVEGAIAIARAVTGRTKVLARHTSYHGTTLATMSLTGDSRRHSAAVEMPGVIRAPDFDGEALDAEESLACIDECLDHEEDVAAVIAEPVVGSSGGVLVPPEGYLSRLTEIAHDHGALLIADEVMTGFGRTGEWFACDHFGVEPDILTLAKGLTGSHVPLAATVVTDEIASHFDDEPFAQGYTYSGHPVACAAGLAAIEMYEDGIIERTTDIGAYLREKLETLSEEHPSVVDLRGIGMFHGLELADAPSGGDLLEEVLEGTMERGALLFGRNDSVIIAPPLVISREEIDAGIDALDAALAVADQRVA